MEQEYEIRYCDEQGHDYKYCQCFWKDLDNKMKEAEVLFPGYHIYKKKYRKEGENNE